jgi:HrpA-like RNA helicase
MLLLSPAISMQPYRVHVHAGQGRGDLEAAVAAAVQQALAEVAVGDVLCFLPGAGEIRRLQARFGLLHMPITLALVVWHSMLHHCMQ